MEAGGSLLFSKLQTAHEPLLFRGGRCSERAATCGSAHAMSGEPKLWLLSPLSGEGQAVMGTGHCLTPPRSPQPFRTKPLGLRHPRLLPWPRMKARTGGSSRQQGTGRDWLRGHRGSMKEPTPRAAPGSSRLTP